MSRQFVIFLPWLLFGLATINSLFVPFSRWAINAELIGKYNMGAALFFSFSFSIALYTSIGIAGLSLVMAALYKSTNKRGCVILLVAASIGVLPIVYIMWLDHGVNNAV